MKVSLSMPSFLYAALICCLIPLQGTAQQVGEPYSRMQDVAERGVNNKAMIADGLEYIASESYTTKHVAYNIFLQPDIAQDASMPDLDPERILAEERMSSEAEILCDNHLRANDCHVFFWVNMSVIPPGDKNFYTQGIALSDGVFRAKKGGKKEFLWWQKEADRRSRVFGAGRLSDDDADSKDSLPYQREVRASHRFLNGAKMVAEDLEFISVESVVRMHVLFHIYMYPQNTRVMRMDRLAAERLDAEKNMAVEASKLCGRYNKADDCAVMFWSRLDRIPVEKNTTDVDAALESADGYYRRSKDGQPVFRWKDQRR